MVTRSDRLEADGVLEKEAVTQRALEEGEVARQGKHALAFREIPN